MLNNMKFVFLSLAYFTENNIISYSCKQHNFFFMTNTPLCIYTTFSLSTH
jgi:hypothetical protein